MLKTYTINTESTITIAPVDFQSLGVGGGRNFLLFTSFLIFKIISIKLKCDEKMSKIFFS